MPEITMSPALIASIHDDLDSARRMLDRCMARVQVMAAFPDAGDDDAGGTAVLPSPRLQAPPLPRRSKPPED